MDILLWIVLGLLGLVVGITAELISPRRKPGEVVLSITLGIVGAFLFGWLGRMTGFYRGDEVVLLTGVMGAAIIVIILRIAILSRSQH